ncbi:NAD-dependent epimerase/dehydratase family protein [Meiothermus rufus]|uniref:NAD-dependent epimerase/dehydratase family protein n=1 Tax=Meiothermus rufus TaxID=604332 RepID=UPI0004175930|nr:SDR family oxidoreductase [Meiothermus rufus]
MKTLLVTGAGGYIGSVLTGMLLEAGYRVRALDRYFFGPTLQYLQPNPNLEVIKADVRDFDPGLLEGVWGVIDLAALSNDPAGELDPETTLAINHRGRARVARLAKERGARRYVLASSCSVYGFQEGLLDEASPTRPLTTYAEANLRAEASNLPLADESFCVTALRQATVYGLSPRMRFDLAINGMTLGLWKEGRIPLLRDGTQWRPFVHVRDTSRAFLAVLQAPKEKVNGQIFNVGSEAQNYQILPLAEEIAQALGKPFQFEWYGLPDHRSYRVSFAKIRDTLGYTPQFTPSDAAREIAQALEAGQVVPDDRTITLKWYKNLMEWQRILREVELDGRLL